MNKTISHIPKKTQKLKTIERQNENRLDVEYELCNTFLKHTSNQLLEKELQIMMKSNHLLDNLQQNHSESIKQHKIFQDNQTTEDSRILDMTILDQLDSKKPKMFSRKGMNNSSSGVNLSYNDILRDVQQNCSRKTCTAINNLISQKKRLEKRTLDTENRQGMPEFRDKASKKRMEIYEKNQEFALMQLQKQHRLQAKNKKLQKQIEQLNYRIRELETRQLRKSNVIETIPKFTSTKLLNEVKKMFEDRENALKLKEIRIREIEENIMIAIDKNLIEKGCQKCCSLIKKIKGSLLNYRQELEKQVQETRKLTKRYEAQLLEQLS